MHKVVYNHTMTRQVGCVKWFNSKAGYGFIHTLSNDTDVFVHHSTITTQTKDLYKTLVQGEYVEFDLAHVESDKHELQATNVTGIQGGKLMCETRHENKTARTEYKEATGKNGGKSATTIL